MSEGEVVETVDNEVQQEEDEIEAMRKKIKQMEEEAEKLKSIQINLEKEMNTSAVPNEKEEIDARSVYVGNVDYSATPEELQNHFASCGTINRVTIICDKFTGHPKGFAYVEFLEKDSIENAVKLSDSVFHGRQIKVIPKRTNMPAFMLSRGGGAPRGGFRGGRGGAYPPAPRGGYRGGGGRGGFRGRGRGGYHPYY